MGVLPCYTVCARLRGGVGGRRERCVAHEERVFMDVSGKIAPKVKMI